MSDPLTEAGRLIDQRRYEDALRYLDGPGDGRKDADIGRCRRRALARLGDVAAAVGVGHDVLRSGDATGEDHYRQSQLLIELGDWGAALDAALEARRQAGDDWRFIVPVAQATLADPRLLERLAAILPDGPAETRASAPGRILLPQWMPYYRSFDADHPGTMGRIRQLPEIDAVRATVPAGGWYGRVNATIRWAAPLVERLMDMHPLIDRAAAARYLGERLPAAMAEPDGAVLDFLTNLPLTVGQRPFVLWYDIPAALFQPFQPFDNTDVRADHSPWYWIVRGYLESALCTAIVTHYAVDGNPLTALFRSPAIAGKLVYVNPLESETPPPVEPAAKRDDGGTLRLLFTSSRNFSAEGFYYRGGVDVLNAFLALADAGFDAELILRTPLPATLSPRLRNAAADHPRIRWLPDPLPGGDYRDLVARTHLFVMPSAVLYRNGIVHALQDGVVPVVADAPGTDELVTDGQTGVIVPGRAGFQRIRENPAGVVQDLRPLLQATDSPADPVFFDALAKTLFRLVADRPAIARLSREGRTRAAARWSSTADADALRNVLSRSLDMAERLRRTAPDGPFI